MNISRHTMLNAGLAGIVAVSLLTAQAKTEETQDELVTGSIPKTAHIWVYDFAATAADIPAESALYGQLSSNTAPQTAEHIADGRKWSGQEHVVRQ